MGIHQRIQIYKEKHKLLQAQKAKERENVEHFPTNIADTTQQIQDINKVRLLQRTFLKKENRRTQNLNKKGWYYLGEDHKPLKEPILLLIRNNGMVDVYEDVPHGNFIVPNDKAKDKKLILLTPNLKQKIKIGKQEISSWIAHEDHPLPFPHTPYMLSNEWYILASKIIANHKKQQENMDIRT